MCVCVRACVHMGVGVEIMECMDRMKVWRDTYVCVCVCVRLRTRIRVGVGVMECMDRV